MAPFLSQTFKLNEILTPGLIITIWASNCHHVWTWNQQNTSHEMLEGASFSQARSRVSRAHENTICCPIRAKPGTTAAYTYPLMNVQRSFGLKTSSCGLQGPRSVLWRSCVLRAQKEYRTSFFDKNRSTQAPLQIRHTSGMIWNGWLGIKWLPGGYRSPGRASLGDLYTRPHPHGSVCLDRSLGTAPV